MKKIPHLLLLLLSTLTMCAQKVQNEQNDKTYFGASQFVAGFSRLEKNGQNTYIDANGNYAFDFMILKKDARSRLGGRQFRKSQDSLEFPKGYVTVSKKGKLGVLSIAGKWILEAEYDQIDTRNDRLWKVTKNTKVSYFSVNGRLLPFKFDDARIFSEGRFGVKKDNKWGVFDSNKNELVVPIAYEDFDYCNGCGLKSGYVYAKKNGKWGVVSFKNKVLIPFEYEESHYRMRSDEWVLAFTKNGENSALNLITGKAYTAPEYTGIAVIGNSVLRLKKQGKYGLINASGKQVAPFIYDEIKEPYSGYGYSRNCDCNYFMVRKNGKKGLVDDQGTLVFSTEYEDIFVYGDYFVLYKNGNPILKDKKGNVLIDEVFNSIEPIYFENDAAKTIFKVKDKALYGFYSPIIDRLVPPAFYKLRGMEFGNGNFVIKASHLGRTELFSVDGEKITPFSFTDVKHFECESYSNLLKIKKEGKWGIFDTHKKKMIVPAKFSRYNIEIMKGSKNLILAETDEYSHRKSAIFTADGRKLFPLQEGKWISVDENYSWFQGVNNQMILNLKTQEITALPFQQVWDCKASGYLLVAKDSLSPAQMYDISEAKTGKGKYNPNKFTRKQVPALKKYPVLYSFSSGLARIESGNKIGFINVEEEIVIPVEYDLASRFLSDGIAILGKLKDAKKSHGRGYVYGYADSTGSIIVPLKYDYSDYYAYDYSYESEKKRLLLTKQQGYDMKLGLANVEQGVILDPIYDKIYSLESKEGYLLELENKFGMANEKGKIVVPVEMEDVALNSRIYGYAKEVDLNFPVLMKKNENWYYFTLLSDKRVAQKMSYSYFQ